MASSASNPNPGVMSGSILVKGVPPGLNCDKLTIHFQKKKNVGGGDVRSVTFPKSAYEKDCAVITFENPETVKSVLKYRQKISGKLVEVSEFKKPVFEDATACISSFAISELKKRTSDIDEELYNVEETTGAIIKSEDGAYKVSGDWHEVQAACERIEKIISQEKEQSGVMQSEQVGSFYDRTDLSPEMTTVPEKVSAIFDKHMFGYVELVHKQTLDDIKTKYAVEYKKVEQEDDIKIEYSSTDKNSDIDLAVKKIQAVYDQASSSASQDDLKINLKYAGVVDRIIESIKPECPLTYISCVHQHTNKMIFIANNKDRCRLAKEQFKLFYEREVQMQALSQRQKTGSKNTKPAANKQSKASSAVFDKDIFGYIELAHEEVLHDLKRKLGVDYEKEVLDDAVKLHFSRTNSNCDLDRASQDFRDLYDKTSKSIEQEHFKTDAEFASLVDQIIEMIQPEVPKVYISKMHESDSLIFTANSKDKCRLAKDQFKHFYDTQKQVHDNSRKAAENEKLDDSKVNVDKDVYGYCMLTSGGDLQQIWSENGVSITTQTIGECIEIQLSPARSSEVYRQGDAIKQFQQLYSEMESKAAQKIYNLDKSKKKVSTDIVRKAIDSTQRLAGDVYIARMHGYDSKVLFMAANPKKLDEAITKFEAFLRSLESK